MNLKKRIREKIIETKPSPPFKSQLEKQIYNVIKNRFPSHEIDINRKGLLECNKRLELDLYFPKYKIGIEIQGPFHMKSENVILKDYNKKMLFLKEKNIKIIYIYTNTYRNKTYGIKKCIEIINDEQKKEKQ